MESLSTDNQLFAGVMSGTSLDGLDIAFCRFNRTSSGIGFQIDHAQTIPYDQATKAMLEQAYSSDGPTLAKLHADFGRFIGEQVVRCGESQGLTPLFISSHGHTIFHRPDLGYTFQLGLGAAIAAASGTDTICDFRTTDVALGGQGAPLVPIGDHLLFSGHKFCLNLGGIANISYEQSGEVLAFDICPVNMALNMLSREAGFEFDDGGKLASEGLVDESLLNALNHLPVYASKGPASLGREWFERKFQPLIINNEIPLCDRLRTVTEHVAARISKVLFNSPGTTMLTTGGGAFNDFLIECIEEHVSKHGIHVVVPDQEVVSFKEALIFALLGWLRVNEEVNTFSSVTGSRNNSVGGCIYLGA
jgi:anhydro-N-acetylmuramic acid kinase